MTVNLRSDRDSTDRNTKVHSGEGRISNPLNSESLLSWQIGHLEPSRKPNKSLEAINHEKITKDRDIFLFNRLNRGRIAIKDQIQKLPLLQFIANLFDILINRV